MGAGTETYRCLRTMVIFKTDCSLSIPDSHHIRAGRRGAGKRAAGLQRRFVP